MSSVRPRLLALLGASSILVACGSGSGDDALGAATMRVGSLPGATPTVAVTTIAAVPSGSAPVGGPIGTRVAGNRVIMIGDSVLASTARRYGGEMCEQLVPLGWQVEIDAETGQFAPWGNEVLDERLAAGWDAALFLLGNNYLGDEITYREEIDRMITRVAPAPVVLVRVTEFQDTRREVNAVIDELAAQHPQVVVLDWAAITAAQRSLTGRDGLHLSEAGRAQLAAEVAVLFGPAPSGPGECLDSDFTDDSRGPVTGTTVPRPVSPTSVAPTTAPPTTAPVVTDPPAPSSSEP